MNLPSSNDFSATSQLGVHYSVLKLYSWPELSRIPPELVLDAARVCALLAVRPTGAPLIALLLRLPRPRVAHIVDQLHVLGHLESSSVEVRTSGAEMELESEQSIAAQELLEEQAQSHEFFDKDVPMGASGGRPSFLSRLWQRLAGQKG